MTVSNTLQIAQPINWHKRPVSSLAREWKELQEATEKVIKTWETLAEIHFRKTPTVEFRLDPNLIDHKEIKAILLTEQDFFLVIPPGQLQQRDFSELWCCNWSVIRAQRIVRLFLERHDVQLTMLPAAVTLQSCIEYALSYVRVKDFTAIAIAAVETPLENILSERGMRNISEANAQHGDLIVFSSGKGVDHMGVYLGGGEVLSKPGTTANYVLKLQIEDLISFYGDLVTFFRP